VTSERLSRPRSARSSRNKQADCPVRTNLCVTTLRLCAQAKASNAVVSAKLLARPPVILCQASSEPVARIELHSRMLTHEGHLSCKFQLLRRLFVRVRVATSDVSSWSHFVSSQSCRFSFARRIDEPFGSSGCGHGGGGISQVCRGKSALHCRVTASHLHSLQFKPALRRPGQEFAALWSQATGLLPRSSAASLCPAEPCVRLAPTVRLPRRVLHSLCCSSCSRHNA